MFYQLESLDEKSSFLDVKVPYDEPLIFEGIKYPTVWHFFYAMKTRVNRNEIVSLPMEELDLYTNSHNPLFEVREDWMKVQIPVLDYALRYYFSFDNNRTKLENLEDIPKIFDLKCNAFLFKTPAGEGSNWYFELIKAIQEDMRKGIDINKATFKNNNKLLEKYRNYFLRNAYFQKEAIAVNKNKEKCDEYAGRGSDFGNPFPVFNGEFTLKESMRLFAVHLSETAYMDKNFKAKLMKLKGKKLGCFCCSHESTDPRYYHDNVECHTKYIANYVNTVEL